MENEGKRERLVKSIFVENYVGNIFVRHQKNLASIGAEVEVKKPPNSGLLAKLGGALHFFSLSRKIQVLNCCFLVGKLNERTVPD